MALDFKVQRNEHLSSIGKLLGNLACGLRYEKVGLGGSGRAEDTELRWNLGMIICYHLKLSSCVISVHELLRFAYHGNIPFSMGCTWECTETSDQSNILYTSRM